MLKKKKKSAYSCNRDEDLHKKACQSMLYVFVLNFQEILGTLLKKGTYTKIIQDINMRLKAGGC